MSEPWAIRAHAAELGYGARPVLAGVDLTVRPGEFWFLIGPNGSGKTTLLRGILGLLPPTRGRVERHPERARLERIGFVPQSARPNPSLPTTVREFVSLGFVRSAVPRAQRPDRLGWALARVGLSGKEHASYWSLSGGQRQRALVARGLVRDPHLLILDEPTDGLDVASEQAFLSTLEELRRSEGLTLLFVTHELRLAARHASHVALFDRGRVLAGPRDKILRAADVERVFGVDLAALLEAESARRTSG